MTPHAQCGDRVQVDGAVLEVVEVVKDDPKVHGHLYLLTSARMIVDDDFRSGRAKKITT